MSGRRNHGLAPARPSNRLKHKENLWLEFQRSLKCANLKSLQRASETAVAIAGADALSTETLVCAVFVSGRWPIGVKFQAS